MRLFLHWLEISLIEFGEALERINARYERAESILECSEARANGWLD